MDPDKDNANPTILNASDLPSRRAETIVKEDANGGSGLFDTLLPSHGYPFDPFDRASSPDSDDYSEPADDLEGLVSGARAGAGSATATSNGTAEEPIDTQEIYDLIAPISDPEHPLSLGSLAVVNLPDIYITHPPATSSSRISAVLVEITPTITHCSLATVIGLGVRVRLEQALPPRFRIDVRIKEGTHSTADAVNKQLGDKERVAAALENGTLMGVLRRMLSTCE